MMKWMPRIILSSTPALQDLHISNLTMIMGLLFLLPHEIQGMIMLGMTHQPGVATLPRINLHLGQNLKLGGRYTDISLIDTSCFVGTLYIHVSLSFVIVLVQFISVISFYWTLEVVTSVITSPYSFYFVFVPRIAFNRKEVRFGKVLFENRFCAVTKKNCIPSQKVVLIW